MGEIELIKTLSGGLGAGATILLIAVIYFIKEWFASRRNGGGQKGSIKRIEEQTAEIRTCLVGDLKNKGLITEVKEQGEFIKDCKERKKAAQAVLDKADAA